LLAKNWIERDRYREIAMDRERKREREMMMDTSKESMVIVTPENIPQDASILLN
jgi:hypothetical protein